MPLRLGRWWARLLIRLRLHPLSRRHRLLPTDIIHLNSDAEVSRWANRFGVNPDELREVLLDVKNHREEPPDVT